MWLEILEKRGWNTSMQLSFVHAIKNNNETGITVYHPINWMHEDEEDHLPEVLKEIARNYPDVYFDGWDLQPVSQ